MMGGLTMKPRGYEQKRMALKADLEKAGKLDEGLKGRSMDLLGDIVFSMLNRNDNFFGSFMVQVDRSLDGSLATGAGIRLNLSGIQFVFNPVLMAGLPLSQAKAEIKHQIYHLISGHISRKKALRGAYENRILNIAADIAINQYIEDLPPWEPSLGSVSEAIGKRLPKDLSMEVYANMIKKAMEAPDEDLDSRDEEEKESPGISDEQPPEGGVDAEDLQETEEEKTEETARHDENLCHEIWEKSEDAMLEAQDDIIRGIVQKSLRGEIPDGLEEAVARLGQSAELPWQKILRNLVGTIPAPYRKTVTRKNRRQPERLDLRGSLPRYETELVVAVDTSGSMDSLDLRKAMNEIFEILKASRHKVTIIECDAALQRVYNLDRPSDMKAVFKGRGGTRFSPVFGYIREKDLRNALLVYFTDGAGEEVLDEKPVNKNTLWILTGKGYLSLRDVPGRVSRLVNAD
jgi:predicted metal-dependent peptidase